MGLKEPNFFIAGAAKSGTSTLAYNLSQHPDIYISPVKEPFYFVCDAGLTDFDEYMSLFQDAGNAKAIGEASTGYLFEETAPLAIHKLFPEAKIIIILRNPVDMAFSYWRFAQVIGNETKSFEEAVSDKEREYRKTEEFKRMAVDWWATYIYLDRALYYRQVKRYMDVFGRDNVRVYIFEHFFKFPEESYKDIFSFLGVDVNFTPDYSVKNEGGEVRFRLLKKLRERKNPILKRFFPVAVRIKMKDFLLDINMKRGKKVILNPDTRMRLNAFFRNDIKELENLLGCTISEWKD